MKMHLIVRFPHVVSCCSHGNCSRTDGGPINHEHAVAGGPSLCDIQRDFFSTCIFCLIENERNVMSAALLKLPYSFDKKITDPIGSSSGQWWAPSDEGTCIGHMMSWPTMWPMTNAVWTKTKWPDCYTDVLIESSLPLFFHYYKHFKKHFFHKPK